MRGMRGPFSPLGQRFTIPGRGKIPRPMKVTRQFARRFRLLTLLRATLLLGGTLNLATAAAMVAAPGAAGDLGGAMPEEPVIREEAELLRSVFTREHNLETLLADHVLLRLRNVIITPHSAFNTREAVQRILDTTRHNIHAFLSNEAMNEVAVD